MLFNYCFNTLSADPVYTTNNHKRELLIDKYFRRIFVKVIVDWKKKQNTEIYKFDWYANPMFEEWIWRNVVTIYCNFALIRVSIFNWVGGINKKEKKKKLSMQSKTWICTGKLQNFYGPHLLNIVQTNYI